MRLERLYAILDPSIRKDLSLLNIADCLLAAGVRWIQLRHKTANSRELLEASTSLTLLVHSCHGRFIVNDRADVAWLADADGVHVGQGDLSVSQVRRVVGLRKMVGISTHNLNQALAADRTTASYVAVGPIFATQTKWNADPIVGLKRLREIRQRVKKPIVAIGGITLENCREVIEAGADSVAVIRDLLSARNITSRTKKYLEALGDGYQRH